MATTKCGFDDAQGVAGSGRDSLVTFGPTLVVNIGFDPTYDPATAQKHPVAGVTGLQALVDTGAIASCIDAGLALQLKLPIIDRQKIGGVGGLHEVNVHLAQIYIPTLNFTIYGPFAAVELVAGGQAHFALIGRTFLQNFTMEYDGPTGTVTLTSK